MKKKLSKLAQKRSNHNSSYWMKKCDKLFGKLFHSLPINQHCLVGLTLDNIQNVDPCSGNIEMVHLIPRENYLWRWDIRNIIACCSKHHKFSRIISEHNNSAVFYSWLYDKHRNIANFVEEHRWEAITRKAALPWTFKQKYEELLRMVDFSDEK